MQAEKPWKGVGRAIPMVLWLGMELVSSPCRWREFTIKGTGWGPQKVIALSLDSGLLRTHLNKV